MTRRLLLIAGVVLANVLTANARELSKTVGAIGAADESIPAATPAARDGWWMDRHVACVEAARKGGARVVFLGDSITHNWEYAGREEWNKHFAEGPRRALNLGFGGDRTEHVLWRLDHGELDGYDAKAVVLMIGTNNTGHHPIDIEPPCDTIIGVRAVLDKIRVKQPKAKIVLCAILPRGADANDPDRRRNETVNHEIMRFADGRTVFWCDFNDQLLAPDGFLSAEVMPDRLHPGDYGYGVWASAVLPYIDAALEDRTMPPSRFAASIGTAFYREGPEPTQAVSLIGRRQHWWKDPEMWFHALRRHRVAASKLKGECDAVFLGDSITQGWEGNGAKVLAELRETYKIHVIGIAGDAVQHNIWRARHGELDGFKTKLVVVMIGTNNNYGDAPDAVSAGIKVLLADIRAKQPQAKIVLLPISPRGQFPTDKRRIQNETVNKTIKGFAEGKHVVWLDFNEKLVQGDGTISKDLMPDYLHPLEAGYRVWADALRPHLKEATGK